VISREQSCTEKWGHGTFSSARAGPPGTGTKRVTALWWLLRSKFGSAIRPEARLAAGAMGSETNWSGQDALAVRFAGARSCARECQPPGGLQFGSQGFTRQIAGIVSSLMSVTCISTVNAAEAMSPSSSVTLTATFFVITAPT
jgi:hypothetical protein